LEAIYREKLAKVEAENAMDADIELAKKFPYNEMSQNGWLPETRKSEERVIHLRKFFEVVQLGNLTNSSLIPCIACRRLSISEKTDFALIAWAQKAKIEARKIHTAHIDLNELSKQLASIRAMTVKNPKVFCKELCELLSNCGIAIVFLPHIDGSFLHGATFYDGNKIVIGLTLRGKDADKFWFSLFHEIGHILLGHLNQKAEINSDAEEAADQFAKDALISPEAFQSFVDNGIFSRDSLIRFSAEIGIAPGIVVGRLQKEGYIKFCWHNDLKNKYELTA
ncbi:MAG: ImmA/IrrE family metallo-endopeptidase, partial [Oscillospiraceae bacterium]|nr:ImmA/IrrE family metallo-endopeptidase [Oscillospiraceae bacterium]